MGWKGLGRRAGDGGDAALQPRREPVEELVGADDLQRSRQHIVHLQQCDTTVGVNLNPRPQEQ